MRNRSLVEQEETYFEICLHDVLLHNEERSRFRTEVTKALLRSVNPLHFFGNDIFPGGQSVRQYQQENKSNNCDYALLERSEA